MSQCHVVQEIQERSFVNLIDSTISTGEAQNSVFGSFNDKNQISSAISTVKSDLTISDQPKAINNRHSCFLSPIEEMLIYRKTRLSRILLLVPRLLSIQPEAVRQHFFPNKSYNDILELIIK